MTFVEHTLFCGEEAVVVHNDDLQMTIVPAWGSNLISLIRKKGNIELLRVPASAEEFWSKPVLYGVPILFPPNRISDGTFTYGRQTYQFEINELKHHNHIHGLVLRKPWKVTLTEQEGSPIKIETQFNSTDFPEVMAQFPHAFIIKMTYLLAGSALSINAAIRNTGDQPFPWGLGYHTTFRFPFREGDALANCTFALTANKQWELNDRFMPTGTLTEIENREELRRGISLGERTLDDVFLSSVSSGGGNEAVLIDNNIGLKLTYQCDDSFKHWVIYNGDGKQGFLCPEPYTWVTNAPNLELPESLTGLKVVQPGEETVVKSSITIESI